jgi:hypothetical protein
MPFQALFYLFLFTYFLDIIFNLSDYSLFTLSGHAAPQSGTLKRFRLGENGEGTAELWAVPRHKAL